MRSFSLSMIALVAITSVSSVFGADATNMASGATPPLPAVTADSPVVLSAAPVVTSSAGSALGEYRAVNCNSNSSFAINNCNQCYDGGMVKTGVRLTGIFDNWTNNTTSPLTAYKDEQKNPNMVKFGNTTWTTSPASEASVWKYSSDVQWTAGTGSRSSFILSPGQKIKFIEADLNAGYTLEKTDKKNGEVVGMLRFPVVSHVTNVQTATEGAADTHYECATYKLDAPTTPPPTTPPPTPPKPVKEMTKTETGPETLLLIAAAFFIAFGLMFTLRKRA